MLVSRRNELLVDMRAKRSGNWAVSCGGVRED